MEAKTTRTGVRVYKSPLSPNSHCQSLRPLANESGIRDIRETQDGQSLGERTSESSVEESRAKKRKGKGKEKESSSGLEVDETDVGMNPELDPAGDGDGDGDDENARRKIKIE